MYIKNLIDGYAFIKLSEFLNNDVIITDIYFL